MDNTICIVEDERALAELLEDYLSAEGFSTITFDHGERAKEWLLKNSPIMVLLDLMLPGMSGVEVCKAVRQIKSVPIIMLTAKVEEVDRLIGLELGADDYICKPYSPREVVARVKAVLRRTGTSTTGGLTANPKVQLFQDQNLVVVEGKEVELTTVETNLFKLLFENPGRIFSRQYIMENIYKDYRVVNDRTVDSHIKKLRKKLSEAQASGPTPAMELIRSVYGAGYKYEAP